MNDSLFPDPDTGTPDSPQAVPVPPAAAPDGARPRPRPRRRPVGLEARQRRQRHITYVGLFIAGVFTVNALVGENGLLASIKTKREYDAVQRQVWALRAENQRLREQARRLKTDPAAIEEAAREQLGLIRPGETLIVLKDKKN